MQHMARKGSIMELENLLRTYGNARTTGGGNCLDYIVAGANEAGRDKHQKVALINDYLKKQGLFAGKKDETVLKPDVVGEFRATLKEITQRLNGTQKTEEALRTLAEAVVQLSKKVDDLSAKIPEPEKSKPPAPYKNLNNLNL